MVRRARGFSLILLLAFTLPMVAGAQVGTTVPLVVDSRGQVLGTVVDVLTNGANVLYESPAGPALLHVTRDAIEAHARYVSFLFPGCGGVPFIPVDGTFSMLVGRSALAGPLQTLYVASSAEARIVTLQSMYEVGQPCSDSSPYGASMVPAVSTGVNLVETFFPPYSVVFQAVSRGPDLTIATLSTTPSVPTSTTPTTIKVTTKNIGAETVGPTTTRLYLSVDAAVGSEDEVIGDFSIVSLPPGGFRTHTVSVLLPRGPHYLIAVSDVDDAHPESKETNNTKKLLKNIS